MWPPVKYAVRSRKCKKNLVQNQASQEQLDVNVFKNIPDGYYIFLVKQIQCIKIYLPARLLFPFFFFLICNACSK